MGIEVALGLMAVSTVAGIQQNHQAAKEQKKAREGQEGMQRGQQIEERRRAIREERIRRARILQQGENTGSDGSSGEYGALSSMATQLSSGIGYSEGRADQASQISKNLQNAADYSANAQNIGLVGGIASKFAGAVGSVPTPGDTSIFATPSPLGTKYPNRIGM
jgi:hypothetical protein